MALLNHVNIFRDVIVVFCSNALAEPCAETLIGGTLPEANGQVAALVKVRAMGK